jgi:hypothetical protein
MPPSQDSLDGFSTGLCRPGQLSAWLACKFHPSLRNPVFFRSRFALLAAWFMVVSWLAYSSILKMQAICSSEILVDFHRNTWRYIAEDRTLQILAVWYWHFSLKQKPRVIILDDTDHSALPPYLKTKLQYVSRYSPNWNTVLQNKYNYIAYFMQAPYVLITRRFDVCEEAGHIPCTTHPGRKYARYRAQNIKNNDGTYM